jgi:hypothetical protein
MYLSEKIRKAIEEHPLIQAALKGKTRDKNWNNFTRTHFNLVARVINKQISIKVSENPELLEMNLIIGAQNIEKQLNLLRCSNIYELIKQIGNYSEYRVFNWISGKTLQSYWSGGKAKYIKVNALLVFLNVQFSDWDKWQIAKDNNTEFQLSGLSKISVTSNGFSRSSLSIVKRYYVGNYYLYYQKTDCSSNVIKTPFILREQENGQIAVFSVSEGHRYNGKVMGIRDGCLYINCQNLDFEEMEQYIFNIGLETKPEVLFGVSNTVSVKNRKAVALKNILVKQTNNDRSFHNIQETEIPFTKKYSSEDEESIIVNYFKTCNNNIITTHSCCNLEHVKKMEK